MPFPVSVSTPFPHPMGPALLWHKLWKLKLSQRLKIFCWCLLLNRLPTRARLSNWGIGINPTCPLCRNAQETVDHIFTVCSFSLLVWTLLPDSYGKPPPSSSMFNWFWHLASDSDRTVGIVICWYLWKSRNKYIFEYIPVHPLSIIHKAAHYLLERHLYHLYAGLGSSKAPSP